MQGSVSVIHFPVLKVCPFGIVERLRKLGVEIAEAFPTSFHIKYQTNIWNFLVCFLTDQYPCNQ